MLTVKEWYAQARTGLDREVDRYLEEKYTLDADKNLYDKETGNKIDDNEFLKYSKIKNGTRLLLY